MLRSAASALIISFVLLILPNLVRGQADDVCREFGEMPSREIGRQNKLVSYIYGRVALKGLSGDAQPPRITVIYLDSGQPGKRLTIGKSGNYCFRRTATEGTIVIDIDGVEAARKSLSSLGGNQQREDFEVFPPGAQETARPGVISTKFARPLNDKTLDLYKKTAQAERDKHFDDAIKYVKEIVTIDRDDFIAWAKLGSLYAERNSLADAESAFRRSLDLRADYTPALMNIGIILAVQKQFPAAIDEFKKTVASDPGSARGYRFLGEAYLQNRQGSLGLEALDKAIELDPVGMAECHLLKARLYDLVGAKNLAAVEYRAFLGKVPEYPDKKKLEKYIKENPE